MNRNKSFKVKRNSASYCSLLPLLFIMFCMNDVKGQNKKWEAPGSAGDLKNPLAGNTEVLKDAKVLYLSYCTPCHGSKGRGDGVAAAALHPKPADHTSATVQDQSDGALYWMMTAGRNSMPSYKTVLSDKQRWELVNYIRTLASVRKTKSRTVKASPVAKSTSKKAEITSKTEPPKNKTTATDPKIATTDIAVKNEDASADTTIIATD